MRNVHQMIEEALRKRREAIDAGRDLTGITFTMTREEYKALKDERRTSMIRAAVRDDLNGDPQRLCGLRIEIDATQAREERWTSPNRLYP